MDEVKARIKAYAIAIRPDLEGKALLDTTIDEVVDRVLVYTNREQLVRQYEEDVVDYPIDDKTDIEETYYTFWKKYSSYPIPPQLERSIARAVVDTIRTFEAGLESREIRSMSDLQQSVTFGDEIKSYLATKNDVDILLSLKPLLDKFRIATIVESTQCC